MVRLRRTLSLLLPSLRCREMWKKEVLAASRLATNLAGDKATLRYAS